MQTIDKVLIIPDGHRRYARENRTTYSEAYCRGGRRAAHLLREAIQGRLFHSVTLYLVATKNFDERTSANMRTIFEGVSLLFNILLENPIAGARYRTRGDLSRLPDGVLAPLRALTSEDKPSAAPTVEFLLDYSGIREAQSAMAAESDDYFRVRPYDIVIRTGKIMRLSDSPIWECSRADMFLIDKYFPDVEAADLRHIRDEYVDDKANRRTST